RRSTQSLFAWLLALIFVAPVGIPLYLLFGFRKFVQHVRVARRHASEAEAAELERATPGSHGIQQMLAASALEPATMGNSFELITDGVQAYQALLELIGSAKRSVHLSYFILSNDETGRAVLDALVERARAGVEVRVLLDAVGSRTMLRHGRPRLRAVGGI